MNSLTRFSKSISLTKLQLNTQNLFYIEDISMLYLRYLKKNKRTILWEARWLWLLVIG